ncbi:MAG TPA: AAA family ATPase, partial [Candidatus Krumholzibacterium sp.]|nr:AAA family ATPase [Candidatus Krumholzibacterium sp.]
MDPEVRAVVEADLHSQLSKRFGSSAVAGKFLAGLEASTRSSYEYVNGRYLIRAADLEELDQTSRFLVQDLIPEAAVGEVIADYGCGKTWVLTSLTVAVAFGLEFFDRECKQGSVLYLAYEGRRRLVTRLGASLHSHGRLPEGFSPSDLAGLLKDRVIVADMPAQFDDPNFERALGDTIREHGVVLVIIDTRNKSLGADQSEDSNDAAGQVNGMLSRVAEAEGATIISAHHTGHGQKERGRGASGWTQGVDFSFRIVGN